MRVRDKVALITGAGGPMGRAIAVRFASEGATVVVTDISQRRLDECVGELEAIPGRAGEILAVRANVLLEQETVALARDAVEKFGRVDVLVNVVGGIAGKHPFCRFLEMDEARLVERPDKVSVVGLVVPSGYSFNLDGTRFLIRELAPGMLSREYGRIVNIASISYAGDWGQSDYAASKAAVVALSRTLAIELAPSVTVNCITPGVIKTSATAMIPADIVEKTRQQNLMKRLGEPREVAAAAIFLGSDDASYITGEILSVSGGIWRGL